MIFVIGDSHISFLTQKMHYEIEPYPYIYDGSLLNYKIIRIGNDITVTAYSLKKSKEKIKEIIKQLDIKFNDLIIFSFGEIDIRFYMSKNVVDGIDPIITFESSLCNYEEFLSEIKKDYLHIGVLAPIPQCIEENELNSYMGFLNRKIRDEYTIIYNERLKKICNRLDIKMIDLRKYIMKNNLPNRKMYLEDYIHLKGTCISFFENELKN